MLKRIAMLVAVLLACVLALRVAEAAPQHDDAAVRIIDGPRVEGVGDTWAVIAWTTNNGGSSTLRYGTSQSLNETAHGGYTREAADRATHRVHLKDLRPGTTYYFIADSSQGQNTGTMATSSIQSFTTKGTGAVGAGGRDAKDREAAVRIIDGPRVEGVGDTWATIAWTTNEGSSSTLHYGTDQGMRETAHGGYTHDTAERATHRVQLKNLRPNTTYYFMADSGQGYGTDTASRSSVESFRAKAR